MNVCLNYISISADESLPLSLRKLRKRKYSAESGLQMQDGMFLTDSPVLGPYLCAQHFRSEVQGTDWGVEIRIYDVLQQ